MSQVRTLLNDPAQVTRRILSKLRSGTQPAAKAPAPASDPAADARFVAPIGPRTPSDPPGPRIVLLNDSRDQQNYGAIALTEGLITILSQAVPSATLLPVPSHWLRDQSTDLGGMLEGGQGFRYRRATFPLVVDQFETVADDWMDGRGGPDAQDFLRRFEGADLVVLNGEGSLYRRNLSAVRELFLAWLAKERMGIPTVYLNGGLHLTDVVPVLPPMVRKTFRALDAVAIREIWSLRNLQQHVPDVEATLFPDAAFIMTPDAGRSSDAVRAVRERIGDQPYFCFDPGAMPMDARPGRRSALYELITALKQVTPQAVLVSSGPADNYIKTVADETGSLYVEDVKTYPEFMPLVADAQFLVSGRYHNVILAGIVGCPSIAFGSTTHKVHGACEMLDQVSGMPYDGTELRPQIGEITQRARSYVDDRAGYADRLRTVCARRRTEVLGLGELVDNLLRTRV